MDNYDLSILRHLQEDGRISNLQLAEKIHLSPPQTLRRVRALEEANVIRAYTAQVAPEAIGLGVMAFVSLSAFPDIIECHTISGDFDYLLKVVASDLKSLSQFLTDKLMQVQGVGNLRSMICMEEIKPVSALPIR